MTTAEFDLLDFLAGDPSPAKADHIAAIKAAIREAAEGHHGEVTWAWVRSLLPTWVDAERKGAVVSALVRDGVLVKIPGRSHPSEDTANRNGGRLLPVYRATNMERVTE